MLKLALLRERVGIVRTRKLDPPLEKEDFEEWAEPLMSSAVSGLDCLMASQNTQPQRTFSKTNTMKCRMLF